MRVPSPYISNTDADRKEMLRAIGVSSTADLFNDIPGTYRDPPLAIPEPLSELELIRELRALAQQNADLEDYACFLGAGSYNHYIPSVVRHVTGRSEFYTSYTPYQAEISQGTLQTTYEFQSLVCELTAQLGVLESLIAPLVEKAAAFFVRHSHRSTILAKRGGEYNPPPQPEARPS